MNLKEIYTTKKQEPVISYEVFPPKDDIDATKLEKLFDELKKLLVFNPSLISVTYGAGGSIKTSQLKLSKESNRNSMSAQCRILPVYQQVLKI